MKVKVGPLSQEKVLESGIPENYHSLDIETYQGTPSALEKVRQYCLNLTAAKVNTLGLFFVGPPNSFKTFLMCYCGLHVLSTSSVYSVKYWKLSDLIDLIFAKEVKARDYTSPTFLLLDDVGHASSNFWATVLNQVLVARKDAGHPTLLCSSLDAKQFKSIYGEDNARLIHQFAEQVDTHVDDSVMEKRKHEVRKIFGEEQG